MSDDHAFRVALELLNESWATQGIPAKVALPGYDRALAQRICGLMLAKCGGDVDEYQRSVRDFMSLSEEFVRLQFELDRTGRYRHASYDQVRAQVYDNAELMGHQYLNGLFLSSAFWLNHTKIYDYFIREFCADAGGSGTVVEVPIGTGLFISEFARRNQGWTAHGIDISESAVSFGREITRLNGNSEVQIWKKDVFELPEDQQYDRVICGELLEHVEEPEWLLKKLTRVVARNGIVFLTTAIWAASIDHIFLFRSAREVRAMLSKFFTIVSERVLNLREDAAPEDERTPINYACVLAVKGRR